MSKRQLHLLRKHRQELIANADLLERTLAGAPGPAGDLAGVLERLYAEISELDTIIAAVAPAPTRRGHRSPLAE